MKEVVSGIIRTIKVKKITIGATSEGIKKLSILDRLLSNGYLTKNSIVFIDELEAALHPRAICDFLDMIAAISEVMGIQFFITTHSYFVIKKLYLIAMKQKPDPLRLCRHHGQRAGGVPAGDEAGR